MILAYQILLHALRASRVFWLWALAVLLHFRLRVPRATPGLGGPGRATPSLTVVLPVRDEERNVEGCLRSLLSQEYGEYDVFLLDDGSRDATRRIALGIAAADARLTVLPGAPLPPGWVGKGWASHQAASRSTAEWLLFTDADVRLHPQALARTVEVALREGADLLSVVQHLECGSFWERVLQPAFAEFVLSVRPAFWACSPRARMAYATGQYILVRREVYERVGGYEAVRGEIVEDVALAARVKECGHRLGLAVAPELVSVRMYHGLGELWAGWRKGLYPASGYSPLVAAATLLSLGLSSVLPALALLGWGFGLRGPAVSAAAHSTALMLLTRLAGDGLLRVKPPYGMLQPLAAVVIAANYAASVWRHHSGRGQEWKGRVYVRR